MKKQRIMVGVLNEWRARILNFFLIIVALAAAVMTGMSINDAISKPGQTERRKLVFFANSFIND